MQGQEVPAITVTHWRPSPSPRRAAKRPESAKSERQLSLVKGNLPYLARWLPGTRWWFWTPTCPGFARSEVFCIKESWSTKKQS